MRIIGGKHRSRLLFRVEKESTRETADMVRESVFNMLGGTVTGAVLDLFSGSGAYALEAISRGASHAVCVDQDLDAIKIIRKNAISLKEEEKVTIEKKDYLKYLQGLSSSTRFDLVFLDPPYDMDIYQDVIERLNPYTIEGSLLVCESKKQKEFPDTIFPFQKIKDKTYGIKRIVIYEKGASD